MHVFIASDHAGFDLKSRLIAHLSGTGVDVTDIGPTTFDPGDDYPGFCIECGERVAQTPGSLGIVIGGSGNGEQIAANLVTGIRAALAWSTVTARLARQHNDANVVSIGARMHTEEEAIAIVDAFLAEPFSGDERHIRRIRQLSAYEALRQHD